VDREAELVERARKGCSQSFRELLQWRGPPVYRLLVRLSRGNTHDAEDLYQETLLKVAEGLRRYRHQGSFGAWVFRIARNLHLDRVRRKRPEVTPLESQAEPGAPADPGPAEAAALQAELAEAVDGLSPTQREVFLMRVHAELPFKEIARVLEAPLGTVLARMSYAVRALRPRLAHWRRRTLEEAS